MVVIIGILSAMPEEVGIILNNLESINTEEFGDLIDKGIIDPTKVARTALEKAVSVAGTLLTTECMIVDEHTKDE